LIQAIKFGVNAVFSGYKSFDEFIQEDIDVIIDRSKEKSKLFSSQMSLEDFEDRENFRQAFLSLITFGYIVWVNRGY
jgi:hypothetical protein